MQLVNVRYEFLKQEYQDRTLVFMIASNSQAFEEPPKLEMCFVDLVIKETNSQIVKPV